MDNLPYLLALHSVNGLGPIRLKLLLDYYKDPKKAWEAPSQELSELSLPKNTLNNLLETRKTLEVEKYAESIFKSGIKVLTLFDPNYPKLLKQIYDPPVVLYYVGEIPLSQRNIGVVGTRKITGYGKAVTEKFVKELVGFGFVITSGLARGVDTRAHQTCVEAGGKTIAVLGGGLKKLFPAENKDLAKKIAQGFGAVISEFAPDQVSTPGNFPARNRIIAGLSLGVLVTEAAEGSGSLITAKCALDEGREVFAIPGPITSNLSNGTSLLIKTGARLVTQAEDILHELGIEEKKNHEVRVMSSTLREEHSVLRPVGNYGQKIDGLESQILEILDNEQKHIDEICRELKKQAFEISSALMKMEINGFVKNLGGGNYSKSI